jgi:NADH-dependent peroxiredoxin subunit F
MTYDLIIIGGGPAGVAAGVYAARKRLSTLLITDSFGGQSIISDEIGNWIGMKMVSGLDLAKMLEEHVRAQEGISIVDDDAVTGISRISEGPNVFRIATKKGASYESKTVLVASGSRRKRLGIPGEAALEGKGVMFCATCDAPLFGGKTVAVVGGGNSGLESVVDLLPYAEKIYLLHRNSALKGDPVTQERILKDPKVSVILNAVPVGVLGENMVSGLEYRESEGGAAKKLAVEGVFVEIGSVPNSELAGDLVKRDDWGHILVDHRTQATSAPGIWAAGDVTDGLYKQNNISVGEAVTAVLNINEWLRGVPKR